MVEPSQSTFLIKKFSTQKEDIIPKLKTLQTLNRSMLGTIVSPNKLLLTWCYRDMAELKMKAAQGGSGFRR